MKSADKTKQQLGAEPEDGRKCVPATDRSETNHKLVDELLKTLCAISPIGMYIAQDGKFQYVNRQFERFIGYSNGELLGTDSLSYILPEDRDMVRESAIAMLKGKRTDPYEYRLLNKAGDTRYIMETVASIQYQGRRAVLGNYMDITERKRAEEQIQHLNLTLQAIRNVNQLITREKDRHRLLEGICRSLTETRGYHSAWIALLDESGGYVTSAEAGLGGDFLPMIERLKRGELPDCARRALEQPDIVVIENPFSNCTDCPLSSQCPQKGGAMAARLARDGKVYGLLVVSMPTEFVSDKEEHSLFQELAGDISFALHSMEVEDKRRRAEHDLNERVKELNILYHIGNLAQRPRVTLDELFQEVATLLPGGWQYPEITWARISIDDKEFRSKKCGQTVSKQSADIKVNGKKVGVVEVGYLEKRPKIDEGPFLKAESLLINDVAERLGRITERKRAEEALRESEEKYRALVENATDFIYLCDKDNKILSLNQSAATLFGKKPRELIGKTLFDIFPREIAAGFSESIKEVFQTEKVRASETKMIAGEKEMWISASLSPVRDHEGKVAAVMGVTRDITERKRAEERIQHLNLALQAIRNVNQLITREKDRHRLLEGICRSLTETRGYHTAWIALLDESGGFEAAAEAGLGRDFLPMIERLKRGELPDCALRALEQPDIVVIKHPLSNCTGCPLSDLQGKGGAMAARLAHDGKVYYGLLVVSMPANFVSDEEERSLFQELAGDIAFALYSMELEDKRKQAEEELKSSEDRFRIIFESAPDAYYLNDLKGNFIDGNKMAEEVTGYKKGELLGNSFLKLNLLPAKQIPKAAALLAKNALGQPTGPDEFILKRKDGSRVVAEIRTFPVKIKGEALVLGIARDITERKQAEEALRRSEEKFRTIFENVRDEILYLDKFGKIIDVNKRVEELFGYKREEVIGKSFTKLNAFHMKDLTKLVKLLPDVARGKVVPLMELQVKRKDGSPVPIEASTTLVKKSGKTEGVLTIIRDITERKQAEEALLKAKEQFQVLVEESPLGVSSITRDGHYQYINPKFVEIFGYTLADIPTGREFFARAYPDEEYRKRVISNWLTDLRSSKPGEWRTGTHTVTCKDGSKKTVHMRPVMLASGDQLVTYEDITERKQAEEALRESEERYRDLFENANDLIQSATPDGHFIYVNKTWRKVLGYSEAEITNLTLWDIIHPDSIRHCQEIFQKVISGETADNIEAVFVTKDGRSVPVEGHASCRFEGGKPVATRGMFRDITERKQAEEARCEIDRLKSEFISNISHELRSPLHSIRGFSNLILDGKVPDPETQKEFLTIIDRQSEHLGSLVDNLLDMSRIEAGQFSIQKQLTSIENVIHSAVETFYTVADEKDIIITEDIPSALPEIEVDEERLKQVMMNLLSNAIKFTKDSSPVTVKVKARDGGLLVQVIDRGIGIPKEVMPRLFERFQQAEAASRIGGAGLGLYISKQIIEAHGGRIWAKSKEGKGSTFYFTLPLGQEGGNSHE